MLPSTSIRYADAIIQRLPQFKELTGIDVKHELTPEENYFDKVTTQLSAGTGVPDVFMTGAYQMWDYASAKRIEPLDDLLNDPRRPALTTTRKTSSKASSMQASGTLSRDLLRGREVVVPAARLRTLLPDLQQELTLRRRD